MPMVDVSEEKIVLSALTERRRKRELCLAAERSQRLTGRKRNKIGLAAVRSQELTADVAKYFSSVEEAFRRGIEGRRQALERLGAVAPPYTPTKGAQRRFVILETAFGIGSDPPNILFDSLDQSENNWAKCLSEYSGGDYWTTDDVGFFFLWDNETGADVVVNVASFLMLNGTCSVWTNSAWLPNVFSGFEEKVELTVSANLTLFELWNQPPTHPLQQPSQFQIVNTLKVDAPCCRWIPFVDGKQETAVISGDFNVNYDMFRIPNHGRAMFEVSVGMSHFAATSDGLSWADFKDGGLILCPHLELEIVG
jgi:hypothetical protein